MARTIPAWWLALAACMACSARPPEPLSVPGGAVAQGWCGDPLFVIDIRTGQRSVRIDPDGDVRAALVRDDNIYLLEDERVVALSPTGKVLHERAVDDDWQPILWADDRRIFLIGRPSGADDSEMVMALDRRGLERVWSRPIAHGIASRSRAQYPAAGAGVVVVPGGKALTGLDAATGKVVWTMAGATAWPVVGLRGVFATDGQRILYALDAETGKELWRRTLRESAFVERDDSGAPLVSVRGRLMVSDGQSLAAMNADTGQVVWRRGGIVDAGFGDTLAVVKLDAEETTLAALGLDDGKQRWRVTLEDSLPMPPVVAADDAIVLARPHAETLYGYDAATGKLLWTFDLDDGERVVEVGRGALLFHSARR